MDINVSYYSAVGSRENNEDSVCVQESGEGILAIVADGLGGHAKGEIASGIAVSEIMRQLFNKALDETALIEAIQDASNKIFEAQGDALNMRTTVAAVWIGDFVTIAANVGDSRIYQFRKNEIVYQSMDHSVAQMAVLVGEIQPDDIRFNPDRNKLIRVLGEEDPPKVDCECISVRPGDRLLICSDGFWEPIGERVMMESAVHTTSAKEWLEKMKELIEREQRPDQDNHTAVAIVINE